MAKLALDSPNHLLIPGPRSMMDLAMPADSVIGRCAPSDVRGLEWVCDRCQLMFAAPGGL